MHFINIKNTTIALISLVLIFTLVYGTIRFGLSKDNISFPQKDHSHFRIKYIFNGQEENFGSPRYQTDYTKDICDGSLTESPLHFHDNKADYQHQHWTKNTGGQFLKFYGLNFIGGLDGFMGFKIDQLPKITPVPIYGKHLPEPRKGDTFWVYTGLESNGKWEIKNRKFADFVDQDFETFFGTESQVRKDLEKYDVGFFDFKNILGIVAEAHSGEQHDTLDEEAKHVLELAEKQNTEKLNNLATEISSDFAKDKVQTSSSSIPQVQIQPEYDTVTGQELKSINNFLGDVVIFVQPGEPTQDQVQARFQSMVKLDKSTCGG
jgi:hypothetical protein